MGFFCIGISVFSVALILGLKMIFIELDFLKNQTPSKFQNHRFSQRFPLKVQIVEVTK